LNLIAGTVAGRALHSRSPYICLVKHSFVVYADILRSTHALERNILLFHSRCIRSDASSW
jgi:hypothetical protein